LEISREAGQFTLEIQITQNKLKAVWVRSWHRGERGAFRDKERSFRRQRRYPPRQRCDVKFGVMRRKIIPEQIAVCV